MNTITCKKCKKEFKAHSYDNRKFCSYMCYWKNLKGKPSGVLGKHWKLSDETKKKYKGNKNALGYSHTEEAKKRMSIFKKGKKLSEDHRRNISISKGGTGISERTNKRYYHLLGRKYKEWREAVFTRDNWTCQKCGARSKSKEIIYIEPHHIKGWAKYKKLRYVVKNGRTLCKKCHKLTHKKQWEIKRKIN